MADVAKNEPLQIRKYPNRRYYDATRSCHVTLNDVYGLIRDGHTVCVTESTTDEDITNLILVQMILERDQPKLNVFPSGVLHMMIRSEYQVLRSSVDRFFGPFLTMVSATQHQFDAYLSQTAQATGLSPMDWAGKMMQAFTPKTESPAESDAAPAAPPAASTEPAPPAQADETPAEADSIDELRQQIRSLTERLEQLSKSGRL